jgi:hypothetical protein
VAVGRYTSDLDKGDVLGPVDYVMSKFVVREYCHSVEMHQPCFQGRDIPFAPPTLVHLNKLRLYRHACPAGTGPSARIHIEYDATIHAGVPVGVPLRVKGTVVERLVEVGAREQGMDPAELRRKNFIKTFPHQTPVIMTYDAGDYGASQKKALDLADVQGLDLAFYFFEELARPFHESRKERSDAVRVVSQTVFLDRSQRQLIPGIYFLGGYLVGSAVLLDGGAKSGHSHKLTVRRDFGGP